MKYFKLFYLNIILLYILRISETHVPVNSSDVYVTYMAHSDINRNKDDTHHKNNANINHNNEVTNKNNQIMIENNKQRTDPEVFKEELNHNEITTKNNVGVVTTESEVIFVPNIRDKVDSREYIKDNMNYKDYDQIITEIGEKQKNKNIKIETGMISIIINLSQSTAGHKSFSKCLFSSNFGCCYSVSASKI